MSLKLLPCAPIAQRLFTLEPEQDLWALKPDLSQVDVVQLKLPKFTDGRAYSQAVVLRRRLGFSGAIRVVGDVLADQVQALLRVGVDQIELRADQVPQVVDGVLGIVSHFYQKPVDPIKGNSVKIWIGALEIEHA